ncbi:MAG: competence/damage-inducible protein A [Rubricoccaceae bacterium]
MTAVLLTVGDELLLGQVVNTNAAWLGEQLALAGVSVTRAETVGDAPEGIAAALERALGEVDLVLVTGGLGPTNDDVTKKAVADVFGVPLVHDPDVLAAVEERFAARGRRMPPANRLIADVPEGFAVLPNRRGTAPGLWGETTRAGRPRRVAVLPGVPYEMETLFTEGVLPRVRALRPGVVLHRTLHTAGHGESDLEERLGDLSDVLSGGLSLAFLPSLGTVRLRVTARGEDTAEARARLDRAVAYIRDTLGGAVFGEGETTLEAALGELLVARGLTLAVAESCTGGAIAARLTAVPGASRYFSGGVIAYGNGVKVSLLSVGADALDAHGAVSEPVARQMAEGVRRALGADLGVGVTGIAGPDGGTPEKPVGTVFLAVADAAGTRAVGLRLTNDRHVNIGLSATAALNLVRRRVLGITPAPEALLSAGAAAP